MYSADFSEDFREVLEKLKKKDRFLFERLKKKMNEILENPQHYKPLRNVLKGCREVHIGSFVILFQVDDLNMKVTFLKYAHHDTVFRRP
ncbi:type II toxin-antitoxin system mRNA interferase toxin, RelE/StbE family [Candidatus Micrarchaeota archaeon]|nr:type II toxin-antitoxin system mRNA interferase toxin, RelE/StbE family [Candidatus Micrarchaeota archaeon]